MTQARSATGPMIQRVGPARSRGAAEGSGASRWMTGEVVADVDGTSDWRIGEVRKSGNRACPCAAEESHSAFDVALRERGAPSPEHVPTDGKKHALCDGVEAVLEMRCPRSRDPSREPTALA